MFTPKRMSEAMDAIRKGTMPGESGISVDLITHKAWRKEMSEHLSWSSQRLASKADP